MPGIGAFLARAVPQMADRRRRRSDQGQFRRSDVPDPERRAEVRRRRRRGDGGAVHRAHRRRGQRHASRRITPPNSSAPTRSSNMSRPARWAEKNPEAVKAFREAIAEAAEIVNADHDKAAEAQARFTKMTVELDQEVPAERLQAGVEARRFHLVDRGDEAAGHAAGRHRQVEAGPSVTDARDAQRARRAAIEADILGGRARARSRGSASPRRRRATASARRRLREALSRLAARGLVNADRQRGFRVTPISRADLADIVLIRQTIEREALRLAMARGGAAWEADILAALHRLKRSVRKTRAASARATRHSTRLHKSVSRRADRRLRLAAADRGADRSSMTKPIATAG